MKGNVDLGSGFISFGLAVLTLAAVSHGFQLFQELQIIQQTWPGLAYTFLARLHVILLLLLILAAVVLVTKTRTGLVCSLLALLAIFIGYGAWFAYSYKMLHQLNQSLYQRFPEAIPAHLFGLVGGRSWNLPIIILCSILLISEITVLIRLSPKPRRYSIRRDDLL